ncbi:hypothetical protein ABI_47540 [Asticcacaulis biprosthecium C19]|uniref:IPT/TIG domain-containing protein n=1 Tax=Asticcacaulis biprosthecium C19 TaxID=715226 RepID=F4QUA6_9CAUL|nr:IPT/TIG domain-containing protein [Asticcacaulis biprosthecium]EGF89406.1 hypothetical protein ABI_47540 [Asticcacaulis biprosthecium C19]
MPAPFTADQAFIVEAPQFAVDTKVVRTVFPPSGAIGAYGDRLPYIILNDAALPWERSPIPGGALPDPANSASWLALLVLTGDDIVAEAPCSVQALLTADGNTLKPQLALSSVSPEVLASQCRTVTLKGAAFSAVTPAPEDLPFLVHCREVQSAGEGDVVVSVVLANRLPIADTVPARYHVHLVSLEGFAAYLGPKGQSIPQRAGGGVIMDVQMASMASWTFVSTPQSGLSFEQLMQGLIDSQAVTPSLRLPLPTTGGLPKAITDRLTDGYVAATYAPGAGNSSFAWYRGPLSPVLPQPLPTVGNPAVAIREAAAADELAIYVAGDGVFDLSFAAAWNIGRALALSDANFAASTVNLRRASKASLARLAHRLNVPQALNAPDLLKLAAELGAADQGGDAGTLPARRTLRPGLSRSFIHPRDVLALPSAAPNLAQNLSDHLAGLAKWLIKLRSLATLPFAHLVPDPAMLPVESIRFFHMDAGWIDALTAGAMSLCVQDSQDLALMQAMRSEIQTLIAAAPSAKSGVLIRSQVVSGWPHLVISASQGGTPVTIVRDDCLSSDVRMCLFDALPDLVTLREPYHGLQFGIAEAGVVPRLTAQSAGLGSKLAVAPLKPTFRKVTAGSVDGVLDVAAFAAALEFAAGTLPCDSSTVIEWNQTALTTTLVSERQVSTQIPPSSFASAGTAQITLVTGGVRSEPVDFVIGVAMGSATAAGTAFAGCSPPEDKDRVAESATMLSSVGAGYVIDGMSSYAAPAGIPGFKLHVTGQNFDTSAVVLFDNAAASTTFVSATELIADILPAFIASEGQFPIAVTNVQIWSNSLTFYVTRPRQPAISLLEPSTAMLGATGLTLVVTAGGGSGNFALQLAIEPQSQSFASP